LLIVLLLLAASSQAQPIDSFERLALLVNLDDDVQVQELSGAAYTGRVVRLTRSYLVIVTPAGTQRVNSDRVRAVALRGHPMRGGALIGAAAFAVLGGFAVCLHKGGSDCAFVGALGAAPIGAGIGLVIGSLIPKMTLVYRAEDDHRPAPALPVPGTSLLEDLALHVNLYDRLRVEDQSGNWTEGRLVDMSADEMTIRTASGDHRFTTGGFQQVAVRRRHFRTGTLIGAGAGSIIGALSGCGGDANSDCPDAVIIGGALGAGAGALVGGLLTTTTGVYPKSTKLTIVSPQISRGAVALTVIRQW
jgi:hypothetical protein